MENTMPRPVATTIPERNSVPHQDAQPYQDSIPESSIPDFYPMIPPVVRRYRDEGRLESKDVDLISLMMGYHNDKDTLVWPSQATLAARMHVRCVDTIQRCLRRIIALGLIRRVRERAARGRFDKVKWDLAALWEDLNRHLEKSRLTKKAHHAANASGRRAAKGGRPSKAGERSSFLDPTMPQTCGPEAEAESVEEADNGGMAGSASPALPSAVVMAFQAFSLGADDARDWEAKLGEVQCLEAARITTAMRTAKAVRNATGYLVGVLQKKWAAVAARAEAAKALAVKTLAPRPRPAAPKAAPAPDPLDALPQEALAALERQARAEMAAGAKGDIRTGLEQGKYPSRVRGRMREMVAAGWPSAGNLSAEGREDSGSEPDGAAASESVPSAASLAASMPPIPAKYLSSQDLEKEWDELPDARRAPYRETARREVEAGYLGRTPRPEAVESRAQNLYITDRKKT